MHINGSTSKSTLLVIDDEHQFSRSLEGMLGGSHFSLHRAHSAQEALEMLADFSPDAILVDMILPDVSGLSLIRRLRASADHSQLPIFMTSGLAMEGDELEAINAGANGFLSKPFSLRELEGAIDPMLGRG